MPNEFFNASGTPSTGSSGSSAPIRSEFSAISSAFDKLPVLSGSASRIVAVNSTGTGLESITPAAALSALGAFPAAGGVISGDVKIGIAGDRLINSALPRVTIEGVDERTSRMSIVRASADALSPTLFLGKTRGGLASNTIAGSTDQIGEIVFGAANGTAMQQTAAVRAFVDGSISAASQPTRISLWTTPSGTQTPLERVRVDSAGRMYINDTAFSSAARLTIVENTNQARSIYCSLTGANNSNSYAGMTLVRQTDTGLMTADQPLGAIIFQGLDTSNGFGGAMIGASSDGGSSTTLLMPTRVSISTMSTGALSIAKIGGSGSGTVVQSAITNSAGAIFSVVVTISFSGPSTFSVTGAGTGNPTGLAYTSGMTVTYNGWSVVMSGSFLAGDSFTVAGNQNPIERVRVDGGGNVAVGVGGRVGRLFVNSTIITNADTSLWVAGSSLSTASTFENTPSNFPTVVVSNNAASGDNLFVRFITDGFSLNRGSIDFNRAGGAVRYNTTSDYRLKNVFGPVPGALKAVLSMRPWSGKMHGATMERPMFVAHELQAIAPYAVSGTKDGVDDNGKPVYQQVDHSLLTPLIVAALQELAARVDALQSIH